MMKRSACIAVVLLATTAGAASAAAGGNEVQQAAAPGVATKDGEISFALAGEAGGGPSPVTQVQVQLIHENCMKRVLDSATLSAGQSVKGPLEQKLSFWDTILSCSNDTGVAEWAVTVSGESGVVGRCKVGYARYWDDGARWIVVGRHGDGPYCPLTVRATCNANDDDCLGRTVAGTGPVRVEFTPGAPETVPVERAKISPF